MINKEVRTKEAEKLIPITVTVGRCKEDNGPTVALVEILENERDNEPIHAWVRILEEERDDKPIVAVVGILKDE